MCPVCSANAVLSAGSITSALGFAALSISKIGVKNAVDGMACGSHKSTDQREAACLSARVCAQTASTIAGVSKPTR